MLRAKFEINLNFHLFQWKHLLPMLHYVMSSGIIPCIMLKTGQSFVDFHFWWCSVIWRLY